MKQYAEEARILVNNWRAEIDINADEKIWLRALQDRLAESLECAYRDGFVRGTKDVSPDPTVIEHPLRTALKSTTWGHPECGEGSDAKV